MVSSRFFPLYLVSLFYGQKNLLITSDVKVEGRTSTNEFGVKPARQTEGKPSIDRQAETINEDKVYII